MPRSVLGVKRERSWDFHHDCRPSPCHWVEYEVPFLRKYFAKSKRKKMVAVVEDSNDFSLSACQYFKRSHWPEDEDVYGGYTLVLHVGKMPFPVVLVKDLFNFCNRFKNLLPFFFNGFFGGSTFLRPINVSDINWNKELIVNGYKHFIRFAFSHLKNLSNILVWMRKFQILFFWKGLFKLWRKWNNW